MIRVLSSDIAFEDFLRRVSRTKAMSERFLIPPNYKQEDYDRETSLMLGHIRCEGMELHSANLLGAILGPDLANRITIKNVKEVS